MLNVHPKSEKKKEKKEFVKGHAAGYNSEKRYRTYVTLFGNVDFLMKEEDLATPEGKRDCKSRGAKISAKKLTT